MSTVTFAGGSFETTGPGAQVTETAPGKYTISSSDNSDFSELSVNVVDETLDLTIEGNVSASNFSMGADSDTLIIAGKVRGSDIAMGDGDNIFKAQRVAFASYSAGEGNNKVVFKGSKNVAKESSFTAAAGDDTFKFKGNVKGAYVEPGAGRDELIFGGKIKDTDINLGSDGFKDTIQIKGGIDDIKSLRITGADDGDILIIGSAEFEYNSVDDRWISKDDPNDSLNF